MDKSLVVVGALLVGVLPWMLGGRAAVAVVITTFSFLIATVLLTRGTALRSISSGPLRLVALAWVGWGAASLLWSVNRFQTEQWLLYVLIAISAFIIAANLSSTGKEQALRGYLWIGLVIALYGFYLYFTGDYNRLTSAFYWANPCAAFLLPAFLVSGWRWITERQWLFGLYALVIGTAFWLTNSRGAMLVAAAVVLASLAAVPVRRRLGWIMVIGAVTFVLSMGALQLKTLVAGQSVPSPGSRFAEAVAGESNSVQDRINYLKSAWEIWRDHPIQGTGAGTYATVHPQYQQRVISASADPHSLPAATLAEQGMIGLLILVSLAIVIASGVWRGARQTPRLAVAGVAAVALALHFCLDIDSRYPALIVLLAMLAGLSYQPPRRLRVPGWRRLILPFFIAAALVLSIGSYLSDTAVQHGRIYDENKDFKRAAEAYNKAHATIIYNPDTWTAEGIDYYTLAAITGGSKRYVPLARDRVKQAIIHDPQDSQHYFLLGKVERLDGKLDESAAAYRQALRLDPWNHPEYYADLAVVLIQKGEISKARTVINNGIRLYPDEVIQNRSTDSQIKPVVAELRRLHAALPAL